ncbi:BQ2448_701 [Microbotryum intermedium]|uniref:BQ2448_701 protein n=1 Tax=Microbotryum intermedium TaxID=269621 RepID=A0A238F353_9BASI|nr:BQ2448_701 [Microbotryum intermedium]
MTAAPSLLSRLAPPPPESATPPSTSSTGAQHPEHVPGAPSPTVQRTRTRGARNRNHQQQQQQSQVSSLPPATEHESALHSTRARPPPKGTTAPRSIPAPTTKSASDLATSRWASSPPPSPPLSKSPKTTFKTHSNTIGADKSPSKHEVSTPHHGTTNEVTSSDAISAIDGLLARLRTMDLSSPSTQSTTTNNVEVTTLPPKPETTAPPPSVPPKTANTITKKPALGGRSMWADDSDDDEHASLPETYKPLIVEDKKPVERPTQLEPAVQISTAPKPAPMPAASIRPECSFASLYTTPSPTTCFEPIHLPTRYSILLYKLGRRRRR